MRLWSYGDSHAAGHELGAASDLGRAWLKEQTGYDSREAAKKSLGNKYTELVREKWYDYLSEVLPNTEPRHCSPNLSYAGVLSYNLGLDFVNRAQPGCSNDYMAYLMIQDAPQWKADDIILISAVTPYRFMPKSDIEKKNYQIHWLPYDVQNVFDRYGPSDESVKLWNQGVITLMKSMHIGTRLVFTTDDDMSVAGKNFTDSLKSVPMSFTKFVSVSYDGRDMRYLGGHFHEECHSRFADYIKQYITVNEL